MLLNLLEKVGCPAMRVNVLSPGVIDTPGSQRIDKETRQMFESLIPRGKMGRPEEIATAALFSCFRRFELREWGGVGCRRRLLGHLKSAGERAKGSAHVDDPFALKARVLNGKGATGEAGRLFPSGASVRARLCVSLKGRPCFVHPHPINSYRYGSGTLRLWHDGSRYLSLLICSRFCVSGVSGRHTHVTSIGFSHRLTSAGKFHTGRTPL
jgi:hypothetical protein